MTTSAVLALTLCFCALTAAVSVAIAVIRRHPDQDDR